LTSLVWQRGAYVTSRALCKGLRESKKRKEGKDESRVAREGERNVGGEGEESSWAKTTHRIP